MSAKRKIGIGIAFMTIVVALIYSYATQKSAPPSQATTTAPVMVQPVETFRTLDIPAQGLPVYLRQGWKSFPIGGSIIIVNPSGRRIEDKPGEMRDWGFQPDGIYTFHADPPGSSRKVRIYNRW